MQIIIIQRSLNQFLFIDRQARFNLHTRHKKPPLPERRKKPLQLKGPPWDAQIKTQFSG